VNHRLLKHGIYNAAAGAIRILLALCTVPILIRCLGLESYGLWALVSAILGLVTLAEGGLSTATTVFVAQDLAQDDRQSLSQTLTVSFSLMFGLATVTALGMQLGAEAIVHHLLRLRPAQQHEAIQALQWSGWVVWTRLMQQVLIGVEQAYQRYGLLNLLNTVQWIGLSLGLLIIAVQGGHAPALMQWQFSAGVVTLLSHGWVVRHLCQHQALQYAWNARKAVDLARQSWMTWVTALGGALFIRGDRIIVGTQLGTEALGIYSAITDMTGAINLFSALPVQPLLPVLSQFKAPTVEAIGSAPGPNPQRPHPQVQIQQAIRLNVCIALGMGLLMSLIAPWVIPLFVGSVIQPQTRLSFQLAVIIYALFSLNAVGYYALLSIAVEWGMILSIASGIFSLICIAIGASAGGLLGAIIGNAGYLTSCTMVVMALHKLHLPPTLWLRTIYVPLIWFSICTTVTIFMPDEIIIRGLFCLVAIAILAHWFITVNQINLKAWMTRFVIEGSPIR
jgi:O-antigen/teichoic acid export membrane protein